MHALMITDGRVASFHKLLRPGPNFCWRCARVVRCSADAPHGDAAANRCAAVDRVLRELFDRVRRRARHRASSVRARWRHAIGVAMSSVTVGANVYLMALQFEVAQAAVAGSLVISTALAALTIPSILA